MKRLTTVGLQVLLSLAFLASAILKLAGAADDMREHLEIAPWFWILTALVEIVGAAGMLVGIRFQRLAAPAGLWIAALMGGALVAHLRAGDPFTSMVPAAVYLVLALAVAVMRGCLWVREAGRREAESVVGACRIEKSGRSAGQGSRKARDVA
jgi:putative oxidoreductase